MKAIGKRILAMFLCLMMVLMLCPVSALADGPDATETKVTGDEAPGKPEDKLETDPEKEKKPETPENP